MTVRTERLTRSLATVWGRLLSHREFAPVMAIVILWTIFEIQSEVGFVTSSGLMGSVAALTSSLGMVAIGVTMLMISGEFDLSVSATFAFAPAIMGRLMSASINDGWTGRSSQHYWLR